MATGVECVFMLFRSFCDFAFNHKLLFLFIVLVSAFGSRGGSGEARVGSFIVSLRKAFLTISSRKLKQTAAPHRE